jgi:hypothetical protein
MATATTKKRTTAKRTAQKAVRSNSPALKIVKLATGKYAVQLGPRILATRRDREGAQKELNRRKAAAKKNPATPGQRAAAIASDAIETFDVNRDQELNKKDVSLLAAAKTAKTNPAKRISIADILNTNGDQSISDTRKVIRAGFKPKRPYRPVSVVQARVSGKYILVDGFHRTAYALENGKKTILAVIRKPNGKLKNNGKPLTTKRNPGLLSVLADAGVAITSALAIKDHMDRGGKGKGKKRTTGKRTAKPQVRSNSAKAVKYKGYTIVKESNYKIQAQGFTVSNARTLALAKSQIDRWETKKNIAMGFVSGGQFHPVRASVDYDELRAGEVKPPVHSRLHRAATTVAKRKKIRGNIEMGFFAGGTFHPIRASADYDDTRAGENQDFRKRPTRLGTAAKKRLGITTAAPGSQGSLFQMNPATAQVTAYRTFHAKGLKAAITFIDKSKDLTAAAKRELKKELRDYHKPPTIGTKDNPPAFPVGTVVKLRKPMPDEDPRQTYKVLEDRGGRVLVEGKAGFSKWTIKPTFVFAVGDLKRATAKKRTKPNPPFDEFQGRPSTKTVAPIAGAMAPKSGWVLGKLIELRVAGYDTLNFEGKNFILWADNKNQNLYIAGGKVTEPVPGLADGHVYPLGRVTYVTYETEKAHLGDNKGEASWYKHRFGDEGGKLPELVVDRHGYGYFEGGDYTITPLGIRD